jgi:thioredoxin 1
MIKKIICAALVLLTLILIFAHTQNEKVESKNQQTIKKQNGGMSVKEFMQKVNNNEKLVFVYFHADWCVPCIKLKPAMDQMEIDEKQKMVLLKIDVDENPQVAIHFEINALPLFMIYKKGKAVWTHNGLLTKDALEYQIEMCETK